MSEDGETSFALHPIGHSSTLDAEACLGLTGSRPARRTESRTCSGDGETSFALHPIEIGHSTRSDRGRIGVPNLFGDNQRAALNKGGFCFQGMDAQRLHPRPSLSWVRRRGDGRARAPGGPGLGGAPVCRSPCGGQSRSPDSERPARPSTYPALLWPLCSRRR